MASIHFIRFIVQHPLKPTNSALQISHLQIQFFVSTGGWKTWFYTIDLWSMEPPWPGTCPVALVSSVAAGSIGAPAKGWDGNGWPDLASCGKHWAILLQEDSVFVPWVCSLNGVQIKFWILWGKPSELMITAAFSPSKGPQVGIHEILEQSTCESAEDEEIGPSFVARRKSQREYQQSYWRLVVSEGVWTMTLWRYHHLQ